MSHLQRRREGFQTIGEDIYFWRSKLWPKTLSWGTPVSTGRGEESMLLIAMCWPRYWMKSESQVWRQPCMPCTARLASRVGRLDLFFWCMSRETVLICCLIFRAFDHCWERSRSTSKLSDWDRNPTDCGRSGCLERGETWLWQWWWISLLCLELEVGLLVCS